MRKQWSKEELQRFDTLLDYYAVALYLSHQIIDSGLLEKKIKVDVDNVYELLKQYIPTFASELRNADKLKSGIVADDEDAAQIADAYFYELSLRGSEWEYADLATLFEDYRRNNNN